MTRVTGVVLAAGAGRRFGRPKGLVVGNDGVGWALRAARVLAEGGCDEVVVAVGARAAEVRATLRNEFETTTVDDWAAGQHASLLAAIAQARRSGADLLAVMLVDLPDVGDDVVRRVLAAADGNPHRVLSRATYDAVPGHPVLLGRDHWGAIEAEATGDHGARDYLRRHQVLDVECGDLASGRDVDETGSTD